MRAIRNKNVKAGIVNESLPVKQSFEPIRNTISQVKLSHEELCSKFDPDNLNFLTTAGIKSCNNPIGQQRALDAIEFGLKIKSNGFNIFVSGLAGTGKDSCIMQKLVSIAKSEPVPDDICYVYNKSNPQTPRVLHFPAGSGKKFKSEMQELIVKAGEKIKDSFCCEMYEFNKHIIDKSYQREKEKLERELNIFAESNQCIIRHNYNKKSVEFCIDGKVIKEIEIQCLPDNKRQQYLKAFEKVDKKIFQVDRTIRIKQKQMEREINRSDKKIVSDILDSLFSDMLKKFCKTDGLADYLMDIKEVYLNSIAFFKQDDSPESVTDYLTNKFSGIFEVNLLVDNSVIDGAPVIIERNPTYTNLFGSIEYRNVNGAVFADHLSLMAGSVHRAGGGYLILEIEEILGDLHAWDTLKKLLRYGQIRIENNPDKSALFPSAILKPEPLNINLKVILTGDPYFYQTLCNNDDEFVRIFKVKADLDEYMNKNEQITDGMVSVLARICNQESLRHCDRTAVARLIDYSSRLADHKQHLSAQFSKIADLLREANYIAFKKHSPFISYEHVNSAYNASKIRCSTLEEKYFSMIEDNTVNIETGGMEIGQINGVSIINNGDSLFGVPSRITARAFIGSGNIINIEREAEMSGKIHAKGVLILSGYLGQTYAQDKPLALSASICFEQHYEEIDGDSASSAELYCLMSSLSGVPLRQDIAVTGSVDQRGMILPVGGINTKIEGFFKVCKIKGLSGTQGIIIPKHNIKNLMLEDEIIDAVKKNMFHVYAVCTIEQGLQILTGKNPGIVNDDGSFQPETIHFLVNQKLRDYASVVASYDR